MPAATTTETISIVAQSTVSVAPLVLLSVCDHYGRTAKGSKNRVVGVLLGQNVGDGRLVRVTNSFAVPFEEDEKDPSVWFLDHDYVESMNDMFKKVNAREKLIGWYHSGPKLRASDLQINELFKRYTSNPLLVIVDVQPKEVGVPTDAYFAVEEIKDDGTTTTKTFVHIPSIIEAEEAEEIGVEHLLRDIRDVAVGSLSARINAQLKSLQGMHHRLRGIASYLDKVMEEQLPVNHSILGHLQDVFNLLPNLATPSDISGAEGEDGGAHGAYGETNELARAMSVKTNDQLMAIYLSGLIRSIIAFHDLIDNKIMNRQLAEENEKEREKKENGAAEEGKEKDKSVEDKKDVADGKEKNTKGGGKGQVERPSQR